MTIEQLYPETPEEDLWQEARDAEARIAFGLEDAARTIDQVYDDYLILGDRLTKLRADRGNQAFNTACAFQRIKSTPEIRRAMIWWASRRPDERDTLRDENPETMTLVAMRNRCRESHPDWVDTLGKARNKTVRHSVPDENKPDPAPKPAAPNPAPKKPDPAKLLDPKEKRDIERQEAANLYRKRVAAKLNRASQERDDPRKSVSATTATVIIYGKQLWPRPTDRHEYSDYDQLYWGCAQFQALLRFIHDGSAQSRANMIRQVLKSAHRFVDCRLREDKGEMTRFLGVITLLCHLYEANPAGECVWPPADISSYKEAKETIWRHDQSA